MDIGEAAANLGAKLQQGEETPQFEYACAKFEYARQGSLGRSSAYRKMQTETQNAGTGGEGAGVPLQNANKGQQWSPAVLVAVLVALLAVAVAIGIAVGAVIILGSANQNVAPPQNGDLKTFLKQATSHNDSEPLQLTPPQKKFADQHRFECFEIFTVKEIQDVKKTLNSTCTDLPQPMKDIIAKKLSDSVKTRDRSFGQNINWQADPNDDTRIAYQMQYSRVPYDEEYRIILFVAGILMAAPTKEYDIVYTKETLCDDGVVEIPGLLWGSHKVKKHECQDVRMPQVIERVTPVLSQEDVDIVVDHIVKSAMQRTVIPELNSHS